jgi:uncharacterized protein YbjT (DUF2867 family)
VILVAGGTGRLGALVVRRLLDAGRHVRVLTRDQRRGAGLMGSGVEVVVGDVRRADSLIPAMADVDTVVSAVHGFAGPGGVTPASVDRDGNANLVAVARTAGAAVVLMSVVGASKDHPMQLFRMKAVAEEGLRHSGVPWTIVRATAFAELYLELMRRTAGRSGRPLVFGRGDNPVNFVAVADVAAVVELAVTDPSLRGQVLEVGGPHDLTLNELAALAQQRLRTADQQPRHVPRPALRVLAATGHLISSRLARQASAALVMDTRDMTFDAGPLHVSHPQLPCTTVSSCGDSGGSARQPPTTRRTP